MRLDRQALVDWFEVNRRRSLDLFDTVVPEAYQSRPIPLRNPICFYEGHLPAFNVNTLVKRGLGERGVDGDYEVLFERGIDPEDEGSVSNKGSRWPSREKIRAYGDAADRLIREALLEKEIVRDDNPVLARGLAAYTILEHEPMHQETLRYMWHRLPYERKIRPAGTPSPIVNGGPQPRKMVRVPAGKATLGADSSSAVFGWDNEFPLCVVEVPEFEISVDDTTNLEFLEFVEAGGYENRELWDPEGWEWISSGSVRHPIFWERHDGSWFWRGMWELVPFPASWPVYVSQSEASAYARWKGMRLPTEAEYHRAAYGTPGGRERSYPWGEEPPDSTRGNFDFANPDPVPVGSFPAGASAWGVHDLLGNGWEWTSTAFGGFPGFAPMPSYPVYSTDFFDGKHFVLKGGSPVTAKELLRRSFRNWFRGNYPYLYATFRCARSIG
ncbi:MAG TPA: SUMF1/EgtB/PvdO family nonheme iron enzyme [Thermoanaerobaculia bacterium]|nr:SUMF1/EgtB/PvdO family nonheme iron enzyme [Thermoanaerobaculia bacterium]